jgi:hypothetical protein
LPKQQSDVERSKQQKNKGKHDAERAEKRRRLGPLSSALFGASNPLVTWYLRHLLSWPMLKLLVSEGSSSLTLQAR